jgi:isovaleryl-CoA dehydrogenase
MNFSIGKDNEILKESIFKFAQKEIAPLADEIDKNNSFPTDYGKSLVNLGFWV